MSEKPAEPSEAASNDAPSDDQSFPRSGRLAAVDFGTVRIGIAICDPMWILVSPLEIRQVSGEALDGPYFVSLAKREAIDGFVVGLPIHCDGGESDKSRQARRFGKWLADVTGKPVRLFDERFTTSAAQARMRSATASGKRTRHRLVDAIAAQVLLESFLEALRYRDELPGQSVSAKAAGDETIE
ncbi:MAG TPA: Holliday junction resolvase RuvX [Planctomycetaceae bacterium]|nr:Holliday junction resolvase RuvX [Planctomycetaceae bacterium]